MRAKRCASYLCHLRGLTFRRTLPSGTGLLLVYPTESITLTTIHMFAVFLPLSVFWIDASEKVVDYTIAQPWRIYVPQAPARFVLEGLPEIAEQVCVGEVLEFSDEP
ncbi:MAG: hypothetical protein GTO14_03215 [Anaerolineales bacterium]|nr:hypothetical protein [Anaerolineales bacterium]